MISHGSRYRVTWSIGLPQWLVEATYLLDLTKPVLSLDWLGSRPIIDRSMDSQEYAPLVLALFVHDVFSRPIHSFDIFFGEGIDLEFRSS